MAEEFERARAAFKRRASSPSTTPLGLRPAHSPSPRGDDSDEVPTSERGEMGRERAVKGQRLARASGRRRGSGDVVKDG